MATEMSKEAMKLALEALEYIHNGANNQGPHTGISWRCVSNKAEPVITALREALAEQPAQQEPVEWGVDWGKAGDIPCVSIIKRLLDGRIEVVAVEYAPYSYTSPPAQRKPLNLDELESLWNSQADHMNQWDELGLNEIVAFVQAAHGIKENT